MLRAGERPLRFVARSKQELETFPASARREAGYQLGSVQSGKEPDDWKPMTSLGIGVNEVRIFDASGAFRVIYVAKFEEAVYVLHCFQKKSQKTSHASLALAASRYRALIAARRTGD